MTDAAREDEARALARLDETGAAIVAGVERQVPGWTRAQIERLLDAWGRAPADARVRAEAQSAGAGAAAERRIVAELRALFAVDPAQQRATPLEVVRTAYREPTAVLAEVGVPPIVRDEFDERAWPDDLYGLVPRTLGDLGDPELAPLHLAWGMAKATVLRARRGV
ncbi:MAG TPA: hypothetical protein VG348_12130 [Acidimicrobiia bacterium]|jgi:hypothetical protein|nr:hypothetical protein [Acidimicrobiia bacterium]